jgi:parallel beta-helix repeat protein
MGLVRQPPLRFVRLIEVAALLCFVGTALGQTTIHVPADQPTIQAGINAASNGDTVLVSPGTYNENIDFKGKAITVTSGAKQFSDAAATVINGTSDGFVVNFETGEPASAVLNGFTVRGGHSSSTASKYTGGISISAASPTITNNIVTDNTGCGVVVENGSNSLLQGNDIIANHDTLSSGNLYYRVCNSAAEITGTGLAIINGGSVQVIGNTIEKNYVGSTNTDFTGPASGIFVSYGNKVFLQSNIIRNNIAYDVPGLTTLFMPAQLVLIQNLFYGNVTSSTQPAYQIQLLSSFASTGPYPTLSEINNTVYGAAEILVYNFGPSEIANNIFYDTFVNTTTNDSTRAGLVCAVSSGSTPPNIHHNDILNNGIPGPPLCPLGPGSISADPQFLDPTNFNFHTQPTSPVVATGDINAPIIPHADLDNRAREVCGTIDMGVYEVRPHPPITLAASANPAPGQSSVTFTATVTGNCNIPTGILTFLDGSTVLGTAALSPSAMATFTTSFLFVGTHNITATYAGDFNFENSTSNIVTEIITGPPTTIILNTVSPDPARPLQPITLTATVSSAFTTPTGTVTFLAGGTAVATVPVGSNGAASATVNTLRAGTYGITAVYGGSTEYAASTSNVITETVLGTDTTTSLRASPNPVTPGQTLTLTATISGSQIGIALTGTVIFKDGATALGSVAVGANGVASLATSGLLTGTHNIIATYSGSSDYNASASSPVSVVVTAIPTSIGLNVSPNPATLGQNVTFVATAVSNLPNQVPTGTITFSDQFGVLGSAPLTAGVAAFSTTSLFAGTHQLTATLNPTGSYASSTSATVAELVTAYDFALAVTPASLSIPSGDYENLTVTVTPLGGFTGSIQLSCASMPVHAQCNFSSGSNVALAGGAQTLTLTINTSDVFEYGSRVGELNRPGTLRPSRSLPIFAGILLPALLLPGFRRRPKHRLLIFLAVAALLAVQGCSGKLPGKTPPGDYALVVTGSSTTISHSAALQLAVTK